MHEKNPPFILQVQIVVKCKEHFIQIQEEHQEKCIPLREDLVVLNSLAALHNSAVCSNISQTL